MCHEFKIVKMRFLAVIILFVVACSCSQKKSNYYTYLVLDKKERLKGPVSSPIDEKMRADEMRHFADSLLLVLEQHIVQDYENGKIHICFPKSKTDFFDQRERWYNKVIHRAQQIEKAANGSYWGTVESQEFITSEIIERIQQLEKCLVE